MTNEQQQQKFYEYLKQQNKHTGVRIEKSDNDIIMDPFETYKPSIHKTRPDIVSVQQDFSQVVLNIDEYSQRELFQLFGIQTSHLTEDIMKECRKIVLKTHPDKSKLDNKYYIFFVKAYEKLMLVYQFQNQFAKKTSQDTEYSPTSFKGTHKNEDLNEKQKTTNQLLDTYLKGQGKGNFQTWFNESFEKYKIDNPEDKGYQDWLKDANADASTKLSVTNQEGINQYKKQLQAIVTYQGVSEANSGLCGSSLYEKGETFNSGALFQNYYSDLKQAYVESVLPITEEDGLQQMKYKNVKEYKQARDNPIQELTKDEITRQMYSRDQKEAEESAAMAYYFAQQTEQAQKQQDNFLSYLSALTYHK